MRVALILTDTARGGASGRFSMVARAARERGHWVGIISLLSPGVVLTELQGSGFATYSLGLSRAVATPIALYRLRRQVRRWGCDVAQSALWHANVLTRVALAGMDVRVVSGYESVDLVKSRPRVWTDRMTARLADHHVCVSQAVAERTVSRERLNEADITIAPTGRVVTGRTAADRDKARRLLGLGPDERVVGWVGRMHAVKNLHALVRALRFLPGWICVLIGDGPERSSIVREADALSVRDRIRVVGEVPDVSPLLPGLDVFCLPSHWEGLPAALLEAMAAGLPVVATRVPGVEELVEHGDTGLLVPTDDPKELATAIARAAADPALGERARAKIEVGFRPEMMMDAYERAWRRSEVK